MAAKPKEIAHDTVVGNVDENDQFFNMTQYMKDAARTAPGPDFKMHTDMVPLQVLLDSIQNVLAISKPIDDIKKALFYGKPNEDLAFAARVFAQEPVPYPTVAEDLLHSILGIYTEAAEMLEVLALVLTSGKTDDLRIKLINEAGDSLWYKALLFKQMGTNFEEVAGLNIEKLKKRFPVKFTEDLALNRDESKENVVFD